MSARSGQAFTGVFDPATSAILPSASVTRVHLLRHGEVAGLERRIVRGQIDDALSPRGLEQHARLVRWFAASESPPEHLFTSDLSRCRELAGALGERLALVPVVDARLREQTMGRWEGRTWADITAVEPDAVRAYWDDYYRSRPTGGESLADLETRVLAWWRETFAAHAGTRLVIVTHIGVIRVLLCHFLAVDGAQALRFAPATATHTSVLLGEAGAVVEALGERPWSFDSGLEEDR